MACGGYGGPVRHAVALSPRVGGSARRRKEPWNMDPLLLILIIILIVVLLSGGGYYYRGRW